MDKSKIKYLQLISTFMITLVITIPIYSASVFAGLGHIGAKGSDNVDGYIKENDHITFEATASISGDAKISRDQVWMGENFIFDSCTRSVDVYECKLRYPKNGTTEFIPRAIPYTINLKDDNYDVVDTESGKIYVDNLKPRITSFRVEPDIVSRGEVRFSYEVEDEACDDDSCEDKCSGIKKLELYKLDGSYKEDIMIDSRDCSFNNVSLKESVSFGDGQHTVYAKAYDRLGQVSDAVSTTFRVDNIPPHIDVNSFRITDETELPMDFASPVAQQVTLYVEILGDDLDKDSVMGDFTSIDSSYTNLKATCGETVDDKTKCTWPINLAITEATTKEFVIEAKDSAGNNEKVSISKNIGIDNIGPEVSSIKTEKVRSGKSYAKLTENNFIVEFKEDGAGLNPNEVILYVENKGVKASNCSQGWTCNWYDVDFSKGGTAKVSIKEDTTDRLGNKARLFTANIIVDTALPRLSAISINNIGGKEATSQGYFKTGDSLQIKAILEDEGIEAAYADLSSIITDANKVMADSCVNVNGSRWQCFWVTPSIDISGFIQNYIYLSFEDVAGNVMQHKEAITVYGVVDEAVSNYWTHKVECSPRLVDRQTTSLINQKVFCHIKLKPLLVEDLIPLSIELGECSNETTAVQEVNLFNNDVGNKNPYLAIILKKQNFNVDQVDLSCPLYIISRVGNEITAAAEEENVAIKLEFYNMPLGELSEGIQKKIDDAVEDATGGVWKLIGGAKKIMYYAKRICQILSIWHNIASAYQLFTVAISNTEDTASFYPPAKAFLYKMRVTQCVSTEAVKEAAVSKEGMLDKFCKFVNCQLTFDKDGKYTSILNKWQVGGKKLMGFAGGDVIEKWTGKDTNAYMDPENSIVVALLTACLPGIIYNLEKWRQIQCMYAHCLQEGVKQQGLPVIACEDQKSYAECKYITGEIFRAFPFTAIFDYYMNMIKNVLANPFKIIGAAAALGCATLCSGPTEKPHSICIGVKIVSLVGQAIGDVTSMIEDGFFKIKDDYCDKLEETEEGGLL